MFIPHYFFQVVKGHVNTTCKCHGVSGSCTVRTCWRQLAPFHHIGHALKQKYENSFKVITYTNQATGKSQLVKRLKGSNDISQSAAPRTGDLVYIEESPSFCQRNSYSPGTSGRVCHKERNCDVMCCGRGYNVQATTVKRRCQCQVVWCCQVNCRQCEDMEEVYMCKWWERCVREVHQRSQRGACQRVATGRSVHQKSK